MRGTQTDSEPDMLDSGERLRRTPLTKSSQLGTHAARSGQRAQEVFLRAMSRGVVKEWIHATSDHNLLDIQRSEVLKGNHCVDRNFDGDLATAGAPRGTWFNANNYQGGRITLTVYPEPQQNVDSVPGLAFPVKSLLGNKLGHWQLFHVSQVPCTYLQAKYAVAHTADPCFEWLCNHLWQVPYNRDEFVELTEDLEWHAVDARERVLVSVFMVNDDDNKGIPIEPCQLYRLEKRNTSQCVSPGKLVR